MADMKGKVVVFSFIYTHCEDVCPYIALKLRAAQGMLGDDTDRVGFVAATTDPQRDTLPVIASYSREIIDQQGRIRVTLDQDALPREIASNVRRLLGGQ